MLTLNVNGQQINEDELLAKIYDILNKINDAYYKGIKDNRINETIKMLNKAIEKIVESEILKKQGKENEAEEKLNEAEEIIVQIERKVNNLLNEAYLKDQNNKILVYSTAVILSFLSSLTSFLIYNFYKYWKIKKMENYIIIKKKNEK